MAEKIQLCVTKSYKGKYVWYVYQQVILARTFLSSQSGATMLGGLQMDFYSIAS